MKIFFPNLDGLRFFAFFSVLLYHAHTTDLVSIKTNPVYETVVGFLDGNGELGVNFFFVLSGFLITYLILSEVKLRGVLDVKSFWIRRILRIWPLYFLVVAFGFLFYPLMKGGAAGGYHETANPLSYFFFIANFDVIWHGKPEAGVLGVLWSVAVEEQFYLIWPIIFRFTPPRAYLGVFLTIIGGSVLFRILNVGDHVVIYHHTFSVISDMAMGGLCAYLALNHQGFLRFFENFPRWGIFAVYLALWTILCFRGQLDNFQAYVIFERLFLSLFFAFIILEQNFAKNSLMKMSQSKILSELGKYTYGLYCLHLIGLIVAIKLMAKFSLNTEAWQVLILEPTIGLAVSVALAYCSYRFFETPFLKLKDRFSYITK